MFLLRGWIKLEKPQCVFCRVIARLASGGLRGTFEKVPLKNPFKTSRSLKAKLAFVPFIFQLDFYKQSTWNISL